jgi:arginine exporter protein ArgO
LTRDDGRNIRTAAMAFGIVFLLIGVLGFVPGVTQDTDRLGEFGETAAKLLGVFGVNWLENAAHLLFGVAGLLMSRTAPQARAYFLGSGVIYLVLWIYGLVIDENSAANILGVNDAGNWLHGAIGVVMLLIGFVWGGARRGVART